MNRLLATFVYVLAFSSVSLAAAVDSTSVRRDSIYKHVDLGGVTVEGRTAIQKDDHINYMPTQRQVDASASGIGLLARMMIPKLMVDRLKGTVKNVDNTTPAIYIDDRKADAVELDRLRPKDIVRVEYYDRPSIKFPADQTALNIITRKYDRGGYVDIRTSTMVMPIVQSGSYVAQAGFDTRKLSIGLLAGTSFNKDDAPGTSGTECYGLSVPFTKQVSAIEGLTKTRTHFGKLRLSHRSDGIVAYADFGLNWTDNPVNRYRARVDYSPGLYPSSESVTDATSRNVAPSAVLYFQKKWTDERVFRLNVKYVYTDNTYDRTYTEGSLEPIVTNANENVNNFVADATYIHPLGKDKTLGARVVGLFTGSRATYAGTMAAESGINTGKLTFFPMYRQVFFNKLSVSLSSSLDWEVYNIKRVRRLSRVFVRPAVYLNYAFNKRNSVNVAWSMASNEPQMTAYNSTEQRVNQYMVTRGNPDLDIAMAHFLNANYTLTAKNLNFSLMANGLIYTDNVGSHYFVEDDKMVQTFSSDGNYYDCTLGGAVTWSLFKRSLQISGMAFWKGQKLTGPHARGYAYPLFSMTAAYYLKNFSFLAQLTSKMKQMNFRGQVMEVPFYTYFSVAWAHKGLQIEAYCANIFNNKYSVARSGDYGVYRYDQNTRYNNYQVVSVNVSYSFDFGRKKVERTKLDVDKGTSGIMTL